MKTFDERARGLARAFVANNLAVLNTTDGGLSLALSAQALTGRLAAVRVSNSITSARNIAWAGVATSLHEQTKILVDNIVMHYTTKFKETFDAPHVVDILEIPFTGATAKEWLITQQLLESDRVNKLMKLASAVPTAVTKNDNPFGKSNSSVAALTVSLMVHVQNQAAMTIAKQLGKVTYRLWTSGDQRTPDIYKRSYEVGKGPLGPMYVGDRTVPVIA